MSEGAARVAIWGVQGRMGSAIRGVLDEVEGLEFAFGVDRGLAAPEDAAAEVVIDFSTPSSTGDALAFCLERGAAFVSGTTGLSPDALERIGAAGDVIPVLHAANFSLGVAVVRALVRQAAAALPLSFHPEIAEIHHDRKVDAPSGTALALAQDIDATRGISACITGRSGQVGERTDYELGVFALRGGDVVGEHTVYFFGQGERVEIAHRATDRRIFARGAVAAARWLVGRGPGRYTMNDVLALDAAVPPGPVRQLPSTSKGDGPR